MLTLGIPSNPVMALMIGALIVQGITPGPNVMQNQPELFWGLIASMWIGNGMLLVLNLPLIGLWVRLLTVPYQLLFPAIIGFCCIGALSVANNPFHVFTLLAFGLAGYGLVKLGFELTPLLLGFVIGPMLEANLRRSFTLSGGDPMIFVERPVAATLLALAMGTLAVLAMPALRRKRAEAFAEG
jgi:putative tricarboxylic transport membrane protein